MRAPSSLTIGSIEKPRMLFMHGDDGVLDLEVLTSENQKKNTSARTYMGVETKTRRCR
jgi:hypothetical protein